MKLIDKICFPTDFREGSDVALKSVIDIAKKFRSEVCIVHVLPDIMHEKLQSFVDGKMNDRLKLLKEQGISCSSQVLHGNHIDVIISYAEEKNANLIILGDGHVGFDSFKLGSNSLKLIRASYIPIWILAENSTVQPKSVLCPIDFSDESMLAIKSAIQLCLNYNAVLQVIHVVKGIDKDYADFKGDMSAEQTEIIKTSKLELDNQLKEVDFKGIEWKKEVLYGDPVDEILMATNKNKIDLLIIGSSGKGAIKRFFLGSVAERVARNVSCSFIINKNEALIQLKLAAGTLDIEDIYNQGEDLAKQGFLHEAILEWKKCIAQNELYFKAWSSIVKAYENLGDTDNATKFRATRGRIQRVLWDRQIEADLKKKQYGFK